MFMDQKTVEHIAKLARIELTDKEKEKFSREMGNILGYIDKLNEVDVTGIEPTAQVTGLENVFRRDEPRQVTNEEEVAKLHQAMPEHEGDFLKVKAVFEEK